MKKRLGFVGNSSSSSFILMLNKTIIDETFEELITRRINLMFPKYKKIYREIMINYILRNKEQIKLEDLKKIKKDATKRLLNNLIDNETNFGFLEDAKQISDINKVFNNLYTDENDEDFEFYKIEVGNEAPKAMEKFDIPKSLKDSDKNMPYLDCELRQKLHEEVEENQNCSQNDFVFCAEDHS